MRFISQLIREIKIQSYLDHPNIAQLYCCFSDDQNLYLMMEVCCGGNIYNTLKQEGRFPEEKVRGIIRQLCFAVEFMHDNDIIHRDIKPENILVHEDIVKVCDFGWSIHSPLLRDTRCGTPLYSSPEVIQKQQYDNKIDVWNVGILAYELLYGRVPFEIRTEEDLVKVVD
jgi:aurora kinase A